MIRIKSYLTFNGNCREAMIFYKKCLGGELHFQTLGESVGAELLPKALETYILQASLRSPHAEIIATDLVPEEGLYQGNNVALMLECRSLNELMQVYQRLGKGGTATQRVIPTASGSYYASLTDRFGIRWMLNFTPEGVTGL
ncbi:VOC family protein [Niabella beijingensis]|uniref:VOC family protein n=1 Tax=Niabella beijingensis TaxID=2872700 RepID=UPI001CBF0408|nr:VOC family protein [Niabella beijingensis]MBZ4191507.1 VOC family protein [Niabella beijingensis]